MPIEAMMLSPLRGKAVITTAATPTVGDCNTYDATSGNLAPAMPALSVQTIGAIMLLEKSLLDVSSNTITFACAGSDTFVDGSTTLVLPASGMQRTVQVVQIGGVSYWKVVSGFDSVTQALVSAIATDLVNRTVVSNALSPSSVTINVGTCEVYKLTALANDLYLSVSGTPVDEQPLKICVTDNGTSRGLSWDTAKFGAMGVVGGLPAFTPPGRKMSMQFFYDAGFSRWILAAVDNVGYVY